MRTLLAWWRGRIQRELRLRQGFRAPRAAGELAVWAERIARAQAAERQWRAEVAGGRVRS